MLPTVTRRAMVRASALLVPLLSLEACADAPTRPLVSEEPAAERPEPHALGVVEITLTGVDTDGALETSALGAPTIAALESVRKAFAIRNDGNAALALRQGRAESGAGSAALSLQSTPGNVDLSGDGTIQLEPVSTRSFTVGRRGDGGYRYVAATYRVRNAQQDGTAYDTPRQNLTFYAVVTDRTLGRTAISRLDRFDGSPAATDPTTILPTGAVQLDPVTGAVVPAAPDVLQVLTEAEVADLLSHTGAGTETVLPYGFVVRNPADPHSRTLPASPAADQFDGLVTFAFKIPLAANPEDDPYTVSVVFMAVDESDTVVTQSLEEQTPEGQAAFEARASALGADRVTLLPGGAFTGAIPTRTVCAVRTARHAGSALSSIGGTTPFLGLSPDPYAAGANNRFLAPSAQIQAAFGAPVDGYDAGTFTVRGLQSGQHFRGASYGGNGTSTITTPAAGFFAGEEVEIVLTDTGACLGGLPHVARMRVATEPATAAMNEYPYYLPTGSFVSAVALADLDGDGRLDALATHNDGVTVHVNSDPRGPAWGQRLDYSVGRPPSDLAVGDLNGDGIPDLVVAVTNDRRIVVLSGNGDGTFTTTGTAIALGDHRPFAVQLGDLNGDGILDIASATIGPSSTRITVALGNGDGTFQPAVHYPVSGSNPRWVELADLDGDGTLDMVTAHSVNSGDGQIRIWLGNGDGTFGPPRAFTVPEYPLGIAIADLNGDGIPDIAYGHSPSNRKISIYLGQGDGTTFSAAGSVSLVVQGMIRGIVAGDLHGDGHIDLVVATDYPGHITVFANNGDASFSRISYVSPFAEAVALGDLNGDGKLDIAVGRGDPTATADHIRLMGNGCSLYAC